MILLFNPSQTPEFSAIENMFAATKRKLMYYKHKNWLESSIKVCGVLLLLMFLGKGDFIFI